MGNLGAFQKTNQYFALTPQSKTKKTSKVLELDLYFMCLKFENLGLHSLWYIWHDDFFERFGIIYKKTGYIHKEPLPLKGDLIKDLFHLFVLMS